MAGRGRGDLEVQPARAQGAARPADQRGQRGQRPAVFGGRPVSGRCGTTSATGRPFTVTTNDSPRATRRMTEALSLRSSDCRIATLLALS